MNSQLSRKNKPNRLLTLNKVLLFFSSKKFDLNVTSLLISLLLLAFCNFGIEAPAIAFGYNQAQANINGPVPDSVQPQANLINPSILTAHNDVGRTGANLQETKLNVNNINQNNFGKLFTRSVDGGIYAQPLYIPNFTINGVSRNTVFVATQNNTVYAFDADNPAAASPLWQINLGTPAPKDDFGQSCGTYNDIAGNVGIISTPVIDLAANTMYVVNMVKTAGVHHHQLHKINITNGKELAGSPVTITATFPGTGDGSSGGLLTFNSDTQLQRTGLLLANGRVYFGFSGYCDTPTYHGWILGYDASTLNQAAKFNSTPKGANGGIWQAGGGLTADAGGNIYLMTGNGTFDANNGGTDYGSSFIKFDQNLNVLDSFTPYNVNSLNNQDLDLGSSGITLIPGTTMMVGGGKEGKLFLVDSTNMGRFTPNGPDKAVQSFQIMGSVQHNNLHGTPVYWKSTAGERIYLWTESDRFKAFSFNAQTSPPINTTPVMTGSTALPSGYMPGGMLSLSANGNITSTGIIWASTPTNQNANNAVVNGTLRAYNASATGSNVTELWNSDQNSVRDAVGYFGKFSSPTIANGKVYLATLVPGTGPGQLVVYGLIPQTVTNGSDNGATTMPGTLSYALTNVPVGGEINFSNVPQNTVYVTAPLPSVKVGVTINGGNCSNGPSLTIFGNSTLADGLVLGGGNILMNLQVTDFKGRQIYSPPGAAGNKLGPCIIAKR